MDQTGCFEPFAGPHGITSQKREILIFTAETISHLVRNRHTESSSNEPKYRQKQISYCRDVVTLKLKYVMDILNAVLLNTVYVPMFSEKDISHCRRISIVHYRQINCIKLARPPVACSSYTFTKTIN
jgi:hypothetical protein